MPLGLKYLPLVILFFLAVAIPLALVTIAGRAGPKRPTPKKHTPFESGVDPVGDARGRFSLKFFLIALLFLIFDVETVFVFPWAVLFRHLGWFGFIEMAIFLVIMLVGLFYVWRKGALEWE